MKLGYSLLAAGFLLGGCAAPVSSVARTAVDDAPKSEQSGGGLYGCEPETCGSAENCAAGIISARRSVREAQSVNDFYGAAVNDACVEQYVRQARQQGFRIPEDTCTTKTSWEKVTSAEWSTVCQGKVGAFWCIRYPGTDYQSYFLPRYRSSCSD